MRVFETRLAAGATREQLREPIREHDPDAIGYSGVDAHRDRRLAEGVRSWSKSEHLARMTESGMFDWCREVAMASDDAGDASRLVGLLRSQGDYQTLIRNGLDDEVIGVDQFARLARQRLGDEERSWRLVYRARLGFTPA